MFQIIFVVPCGDHVHHHRVETDDPETAEILADLANEINNNDRPRSIAS